MARSLPWFVALASALALPSVAAAQTCCIPPPPVAPGAGGGGGSIAGGGTIPGGGMGCRTTADPCDWRDYLPEPGWPIKVVRVNFIVLQRDDGTGNFQPGDMGLDFIEQYLENTAFINNAAPTRPVLPAADELSSAYIQFDVVARHYVQDTAHRPFSQVWNGTTPNVHATDRYSEVNVFLAETDGSTTIGGFANTAPNPGYPGYGWAYIGMNNVWSAWSNNAASWAWSAVNIAHELGHVLGLSHTHLAAGPMDCFPDTPVDGGCCPKPNAMHSNNVMSYNWGGLQSGCLGSSGNYLSPMQIGWMHANLERNPRVHQYLYAPPADCVYDPMATISVSGNQLWTDDRNLTGDVIVEAGSRLTIRCAMISFPSEARLIVENGAELILDEATLTCLCPDEMWRGVELWGDPTLPQAFNQAKLTMENRSVIENAREGISTSRRNGGGYVWTHTGGGIVQATDSYFRNNKRSAEFMKYENVNAGIELDNESSFDNCVFETYHPLRDPAYQVGGLPIAATAHVTQWGTRGVDFTDCRFLNRIPQLYQNQGLFGVNGRRGTGILSVDASYRLQRGSGPTPEFQALTKGVDFAAMGSKYRLDARSTNFRQNDYGVSIYGGGGHGLRNCYIPNTGIVDPQQLFLVGVSAVDTAGITMFRTGIHFTNAPFLDWSCVLQDTNFWGGLVYDCDFGAGLVAFQAEGDNPHLDFRCNDLRWYTGGVVLDTSMVGMLPIGWGCGLTPTEGLGNKFHETCTGAPPAWDIWKGNALYPFGYRESTGAPLPPVAVCCSLNVSISDCAGAAGTNPCNLTFFAKPADELMVELQAVQLDLAGVEAKLDVGTTAEELIATIAPESGVKEAELVQVLAAAAPLSDAVLVALAERQPPLSDDSLVAVWKPSAPLAQAAVDAFLGAEKPPGPSALKTLEGLQGHPTPAGHVREELGRLRTREGVLSSQLLRAFADDPSYGDGAIAHFLLKTGTPEAHRQLVPLLIELGDTKTSRVLLAGLGAEHASFVELMSLRVGLVESGRNLFQMDDGEIARLRAVSTSNDSERYYALAVLKLLFEEDYAFQPQDVALGEPGK